MGRGLTDRRQFVEQQLFDVELRLDRARGELELVEHQLRALSAYASEAEARRSASETPLADRHCAAVHERLAVVAAIADRARRFVGDLERTRDGLFAKLVG